MLSVANLYNSASSNAAKPIRIQPIFTCILFQHYKQLVVLSKEIEIANNNLRSFSENLVVFDTFGFSALNPDW
jgi:hypothetical protein